MEANRKTSVGFVVELRDGRYLFGRATGHKEPNNYTIFKGQIEDGESLIDTAIRELREESGIDVSADDRLNKHISSTPIFTYHMSQKDVIVFLLVDSEGVLDSFEFSCSSFFQIDGKDYPEIDAYKKFTLDELEKVVFSSQLGLVEELKRRKKK